MNVKFLPEARAELLDLARVDRCVASAARIKPMRSHRSDHGPHRRSAGCAATYGSVKTIANSLGNCDGSTGIPPASNSIEILAMARAHHCAMELIRCGFSAE